MCTSKKFVLKLKLLIFFITLFKFITILCETEHILWYIPNVQIKCGNILQIIVNPT